MSLTVTRVFGPESIGGRYMSVSKIDFDSSYPTGGEVLLPTDLGYALSAAASDPEFHAEAVSKNGYLIHYDHTNSKILVYSSFETLTATYDPASLASVTARDDTVTVTGIVATDVIIGFKAPAAFTAGLVIDEVRASATDTVTVRLNNPTAGAVDGASGTLTVYVASVGGAVKEIVNATDLSALTAVRVVAYSKFKA